MPNWFKSFRKEREHIFKYFASYAVVMRHVSNYYLWHHAATQRCSSGGIPGWTPRCWLCPQDVSSYTVLRNLLQELHAICLKWMCSPPPVTQWCVFMQNMRMYFCIVDKSIARDDGKAHLERCSNAEDTTRQPISRTQAVFFQLGTQNSLRLSPYNKTQHLPTVAVSQSYVMSNEIQEKSLT